MGHKLAVDMEFTNAAGDEERVLRAEVDDDDSLALGGGNGRDGSYRALAGLLLGNLKVGAHLDVAAGGHAVAMVSRWARLGVWHGESRLALCYTAVKRF